MFVGSVKATYPDHTALLGPAGPAHSWHMSGTPQCPEHKLPLVLEYSAGGHNGAHNVVTSAPKAGVLEQGHAGSVSIKDVFMHQEPDTSQTCAASVPGSF